MVPLYLSTPDWLVWALYGIWLGPHVLVVLMGKPKLVPLVVLIHFALITAMVVKGLVFGAAFGSLFGPVMLTIVGAAIAAGLASFILACGAEWLYAKRKT